MENYQAPIRDMLFAMTNLADIDHFASKTKNDAISSENISLILEEAGKFASEILDPINQKGDLEGIKLENGVVRMPTYFIEAYKDFVKKGWFSVIGSSSYGGQDLPWSCIVAINEIWESANMSFAVNNLLTQGAIELLEEHGTQKQKEKYLPKLITGEWSGTMNLTEPHAGSDLSLLKTKAEKKEGQYLVKGTKIYITHGDQDMSENIIHLVLARLPDAPPGIKGISLFLVPKFLTDNNGKLKNNDIKVVSVEHKLGHHASPTCVLSFGEDYGAEAEIIGEPHQGLKAMFTMMNNARLNVGVQGIAISERSYQKALNFSRNRKQGTSLSKGSRDVVDIIKHPDVKRMLMEMKSQTEAMRALAIVTGEMLDYHKKFPGTEDGKRNLMMSNLLTPVIKSWCTDQAVYITSLGIQVHGGMGFIEDTGAAQYFRDSRILPIYEGTNGIQALDLMRRKIFQENGRTFDAIIEEIENVINEGKNINDTIILDMCKNLENAKKELKISCEWLKKNYIEDPEKAASGATPFLNMFGWVLGGWIMIKSSIKAKTLLVKNDNCFLKEKISTARFFCDTYLPTATALKSTIINSHRSINIIY